VHGNRTRFAGILEWLKKKDFAVTVILQPLDVEDGRGVEELARVVDRLEVVRSPVSRQGWVSRIKQAASVAARLLLPGRIADRLRRGEWTSVPAEPSTASVAGDRDIDDWCWPTTCEAVRRAVRREHPIAVIAEYALLSKSLEDVPPAVMKVIDTVEVFFRNSNRFQTEGLEAPVVCTPASEKRALGRADLLVAIQKNDAKALQECCPGTRIVTVPHFGHQGLSRRNEPVAGTVLYVGSSNAFNVHGLGQFLDRAWPEIARRVPEATLRIVGSVPRVERANDVRILHVGRVTDQELAREYQTANVVINPQVAGTGLKIKCVEALSAGCPLVTNAAGADGLEEGAGSAFLLARDWGEFAEHVVTLLGEASARRSLELQASMFARRMFSVDAAFAELDAVLGAGRSGLHA
jgi:glycosyltransferase involved in cell wall biosynthesis